jgi:hypothetical protein
LFPIVVDHGIGCCKSRPTATKRRNQDKIVIVSDVQSPLAIKIGKANPRAYEALVVEGGTPALARELLEGVKSDQLLAVPIASPRSADAMLAGLWLWHDGLEESHTLSQKLDTPDGSYWHAIMHRREGDFSNSKYWLARCRSHPSSTAMAQSLPKLIESYRTDPAVRAVAGGGWDPMAFVDLVEQIHNRPDDPRRSTVIAIQQLEWRILFAHCAAAAVS